MRLKLPILDVYAPIQVTLQTDKVADIPCGTKVSPRAPSTCAQEDCCLDDRYMTDTYQALTGICCHRVGR